MMLNHLTTTADEDLETTIKFSIGKNRFDANPQPFEVLSFSEFQDKVLTTRSAIKGLFYVAASFEDGRRSRDSAEPTSFLCFDFDGVPSSETFAQLCMYLSRYHGFGYTTASHRPDSPRARAIIAASRPMARQERIRVSKYVQQCIETSVRGLKFDESVYRPEQPCFTPVFESQSFSWDGEPVDVDKVLAMAPELKAEGPTAAENLVILSSTDPIINALRDQGMIKRDLGGGKFAIHCPCANYHSGPSPSETTTTYSLPHTNGFVTGNFSCLHAHCADRPQAEFIEALGLNAKQAKAEQTKVPDVDHSQLIERMQVKQVEQEIERQEERKQRFKFLTPGQLVKQQRVGWRVLDVIPKKGLVVMWGAPGSGKSFAAFDIGAAIARGHKYHGKRTKRGLVLIIAAEGDLTSRTMAYVQEHGIEDGELDNLLVMQRSVNLMDPTQDLADLVDSIQEIVDSVGEDLALLVIDTLNRVMPGGNENASEDMGAVISNAKLIEDAFKCAVMFVHHSGKDETKGSRGHSSLKGAMDAEISIIRNEDIRTFRIEKQKEGMDYYDLFNFKLKTVDLGPMRDYDQDAELHERLTSCVIEHTNEVPAKREPSTKNTGLMQAALLAAGSNSKEVVRLKYYELHTGSAEAKKKAFQRDWAKYMNDVCRAEEERDI
jgi:AAA domain